MVPCRDGELGRSGSIIRHAPGRGVSGMRSAATPRALPGPNSSPASASTFPLACSACGGDIRPIAFITDPAPIRTILTHLGEPLEPPPLASARGPSTGWAELVQGHDDRDEIQSSPDDLPVIGRHTVAELPLTVVTFKRRVPASIFQPAGSAFAGSAPPRGAARGRALPARQSDRRTRVRQAHVCRLFKTARVHPPGSESS